LDALLLGTKALFACFLFLFLFALRLFGLPRFTKGFSSSYKKEGNQEQVRGCVYDVQCASSFEFLFLVFIDSVVRCFFFCFTVSNPSYDLP
jgi:hypothetical protein